MNVGHDNTLTFTLHVVKLREIIAVASAVLSAVAIISSRWPTGKSRRLLRIKKYGSTSYLHCKKRGGNFPPNRIHTIGGTSHQPHLGVIFPPSSECDKIWCDSPTH